MLPTLVVVSGPPGGYGKTTLAHEIARTVGCPAICRDEIKEGIVHNNPGFLPAPGDWITQKTLPLFFDVLTLLLRAGTTVVAESAWQDKNWRPGLEPLTDLADIRIIQCTADLDAADQRARRRYETNPAHQAAHTAPGPNRPSRHPNDWYVGISLPAPRLLVDTTNGYHPSIQEIMTFIEQH